MLISPEYQKEQQKLHKTGKYGVVGGMYAPMISRIMEKLEIKHLLDYGCGSRLSLFNELDVKHKFKYQAFDPCVEKYSSDPVPAEMVCCIDVLEHIEPEYLEGVLDHLEELTEQIGIFTVFTGPAKKIMEDGRNVHLTQQPMEWWMPKIWDRFDIQTLQVTGEEEMMFLVHARA